ncbi:N-terminal fungal transcription regulatory domain-containing protein [Trichoderma citrinoviride]|uniref:N-terminal fungal transcription regulatory domain-containing protein n=1 Tax=Trichoderma citrinoviride TaxID=58853 RepID=A0A2T4BH09_9HYPO|nr:N-terminal fungal transcription regulatory domain-containing protein [Trichoderma citrinoviride]PTB68603.1 N-terminal fungal transcription regulatory domain-containing protein [Trichoderma citrinoviride]
MKVRKLTVCHTCRARKLGCDGKRPSCSQCAGTKIKCGGYQYDLVFIPSQLSIGASAKSKTRKDGKITKKERECTITRTDIPADTCDDIFHDTRLIAKHAAPVVRPSLAWPFQDIISLVVQNFSPTVLSSNSAFMNWDVDIHPRVCGAWIELLPVLSLTRRYEMALSSSVKALGVSILSRGRNGIAPISDALTAHCSALHSLHDSLHDITHTADSDVLAVAIMCLMISEIILPTAVSSSSAHAAGLSDLIQLHSPEAYSTGPSHRIFIGLRPAMIIHSIRTKNPTFLASPEWRTIPFQYVEANSFHALMTEATAIPSILVDIDRLKYGSPNANAPRAVLEDLKNLLDALVNWNVSFQSLTNKPSFRVLGKSPEKAHIWFPDITTANSMTHYWTFWIMCVVYIRKLREDYPELRDEELLINGESPESPLITEMAIQMSTWIFQSIEYLVQDEMRLFGAISATLPTRIAYQFLRYNHFYDQELISWCERVIDGIRDRGYDYIAQYIVDDDGV